jgi:hypothetical protein
MEVFPIGMPRPYKHMMLVHAEGDVPHVAVKDLLRNAQPLRCINKPVIPLGEHHVFEGRFL